MAGTITQSQLTAATSAATYLPGRSRESVGAQCVALPSVDRPSEPDSDAVKARFALAAAEDDPAIRRLLRENPMNGEVSLSFEREPNYFRSTQIAGADDQTILGFERGRLIVMGRCSVRTRYVNGRAYRVGYLSDLRLDSSAQGRFDLLRRGYRFFRELHRTNPADLYFTSVAADNFRSLRFLERGLPGMPIYEPLTDFVTLLIPVPRKVQRVTPAPAKGRKLRAGSVADFSALAGLLNSHARQHNLAAAWDEETIGSLEHHGLSPANFQLLVDEGRIVACGALWDQRCFRQIVIRGYSRRLAFIRPGLNLVGSVLAGPQLPRIGSTLANGFLSPLAVSPDDAQALLALIESSRSLAANRGLACLTLGFAGNDPRLEIVRRRFRCREYNNRLFRVRWKEASSTDLTLNDNLILPEVALL